MEKLPRHSGLIHIEALPGAINFKLQLYIIYDVNCVDHKISNGYFPDSTISLIGIVNPDYDVIYRLYTLYL
jgi:hypothetical protein